MMSLDYYGSNSPSTSSFNPQDDAYYNMVKFHMLNNSLEHIEQLIELADKQFKDSVQNDYQKSSYVSLHAEFGRLLKFCAKVINKKLNVFGDYNQMNHLISPKFRMIAQLLFTKVDHAFAKNPQHQLTAEFVTSIQRTVEVNIFGMLAEGLEMKQEGVFSANFLFGQCVDKMLEFVNKIGTSPGQIITTIQFRQHERNIKKHTAHWAKIYYKNCSQ